MSETLAVSGSGPVFSSLFYENIKNEYDQEGFIVGDIITKETNKVTDADHQVINRERIIKVKAIVPCPHQFYFYNAAGKIDIEKIRSFLGDQESKIIGWYIFKRKRFSTVTLTFREKMIHKQLAELFRPAPAFFTCCLLTIEHSNNRATYSLSQTFVRHFMSRYESLPLHIINLSDPNFTFKSAEVTSDIVNQVITSMKDSGDCEGYLAIQNVQDSLQKHMKDLVQKSVEKEQRLFALEQRVKQLQQNKRLNREYGVQENESNQPSSEVEIIENGTSNNTCSQNNSPESVIEKSPEAPRKRGRPRKLTTTLQNNSINKSPGKNSDSEEFPKENETVKSTKLRSRTNLSYSEIAQKNKN